MLMLSTSSYTLFNIERNFVIFTHREEANFNRAHQGSSYIHNCHSIYDQGIFNNKLCPVKLRFGASNK